MFVTYYFQILTFKRSAERNRHFFKEYKKILTRQGFLYIINKIKSLEIIKIALPHQILTLRSLEFREILIKSWEVFDPNNFIFPCISLQLSFFFCLSNLIGILSGSEGHFSFLPIITFLFVILTYMHDIYQAHFNIQGVRKIFPDPFIFIGFHSFLCSVQ